MRYFFILLITIFLSSCIEPSSCASLDSAGNCIEFVDCSSDSECKENEYCNANANKCYQNICKKDGYEDACGAGQCIIDKYGKDSCLCDEGYAQQDGSGCLLKCNSYTDCIGFQVNERNYPICSTTINGGICNIALCLGENSCPIGGCEDSRCVQ